MGRKSRRSQAGTETVQSLRQGLYRTAIYARLSVENSGKDDEGASIENQINVCREYIKVCPDLRLAKVYQDNGWTGTVMRRPAFDEMMADIESGQINAIVVRDLSRFARNYIETGTYLEQIFPNLNVRFISVKEQLDTLNADGTNESLMIPLQNLINDLYSKDISRKVEAALHTQMETGTFAWRQIPYGYKKDEISGNIVPDERTAPYVRDMFRWRAEGMTKADICRKLDECNAPKYHESTDGLEIPWARSTIYQILSNPAYAGMRVYGKRHSAIYKGIKLEKKPEAEWYVTENAHEALVSRELFDAVRQMDEAESVKRQVKMRESAEARSKLVDLFAGKFFCADCGHKMYYKRGRMDCKDRHWYGSYFCSSSQARAHHACSAHGIRQEALEEKVLAAIQMQVKTATDYKSMIRSIRKADSDRDIREEMNSEVQSVTLRLQGLKNRRARLYEDHVTGLLDESEYAYARSRYEEECAALNAELERLTSYRRDFQEALSSDNKWIRLLTGIRKEKRLSQGLVDALVEKVRAFEGGAIEVTMKYQDIYDMTRESLDRVNRKGDSEDA